MEKEGQKIMVAVDESQESMYALSWCLGNLISDTTTDQLVLLYVKPPPSVYSSFDIPGNIFSSDALGAVEKYGRDLAASVMERAEAMCRNINTSNIKMERVIGSGDAKNVICSAVQKLKADTLVMGSHGYGFFKRALLGSVSEYCAKHAKCPVVIVKHP
ncbi:universal stress protein A-like protein [Prosopis cineraria]|uniref:universal stress protein A-like protein n=1 Tax=Prosopis cineraria TaxID=364024 RepID=UPI0024106D17|nr:universal stress protein A-like protein [Prosopis cineraria]